MKHYHDTEWGKPCHDERLLFELLILEGAQAGLSWDCVLNKRENYKKAFDDFDVAKIAKYGQDKVNELMQNSGIIRNNLKINATIINAQKTIELGGLNDFLWGYTDGKPIVNRWLYQEKIPTNSKLSDQIDKDMKKLGFKFVGSTVIYSYLQAVGIINDHVTSCEFK